MGYCGVMLKPVQYRPRLDVTEHQNFIYDKYDFLPGGTALWVDIVTEFKDWKRLLKIDYLIKDEILLKEYLKECPYLFYETVWSAASEGKEKGDSGIGYYGMQSKKQSNQQRTSSTSCKVEKKNLNNVVLSVFKTIAKAASVENLSPATMSRSIKNKKIFEGDGGSYFYAKV